MAKNSGALNRHKYWVCPFFKWDGRQEISCDAGRIRFPTKDSANAYMDGYCACNKNWQNCTLAAALLKYYEDMEDRHEKR